MNTKTRLLNLKEVLDKNSISSIWENDTCLLIKSEDSNGFDIKFEFTQFDVFLWFDDVAINVHPKEFDKLIYYIKLAFTGKLRIRKTSKKSKVIKLELLGKENDSWETEITLDHKDWKFWIKEDVQILENDYKVALNNLKNI